MAKAVLYAGGGFLSTIATILVVAGSWEIDNDITRFALVVACIVAATTLFVCAFISRIPSR
ncbi:hypothetical protein [Actinoplanes sp. ATCC 53533]|uniref:hypothetical protein n=1 Tax=Actinoplanes sp. ATCC 53533 TaxID=1288362 RepID=UPI000F79E174|nr:hypothetical protein [Actinoplanes sp. ATCC 53533]